MVKCKGLITLTLLFLSYAIIGHAQTAIGDTPKPSNVESWTTPMCSIDNGTNKLYLPCSLGPRELQTLSATKKPLSYYNAKIWIPNGHKYPKLSKTYWLLEIGAIGMGILDEEKTQHLLHEKLNCNAQGQCFQYKEADPILGSSRAQAYSVLGAFDIADIIIGRQMERHEQLRSQVGLPSWRHGWEAWYYNYRVPLVAQMIWHFYGVLRVSHQIL